MNIKSKLVKNKNFFQIVCEQKGIKDLTNEAGEIIGVEIEGYASTKDKDRVNDIVEPTAFKDAIDLYMTNPVVLLQHDVGKPIGIVTEASIRPEGLYIKAKITQDVDGIFSALKNKVLRAFSIGYRVKDYVIQEVKDGEGFVTGYETIIKSLERYETSVISIPANAYALMKSMNSCVEVKELEASEASEVKDGEEVIEEVVEITEVIEEEKELGAIEGGVINNIPTEEEQVILANGEQGELGTSDEEIEEEENETIEEKEIAVIEKKALSKEDTIEMKITNKLIAEKGIEEGSNEHIYVCGLYNTEFIYNHYKFGDNGFDIYYRRGYSNNDGEISLTGEDVEVETTTQWTDTTKLFKDQLIKDANTTNMEVKSNEIKESENPNEIVGDDVQKDVVDEGKELEKMARKNVEKFINAEIDNKIKAFNETIEAKLTLKNEEVEKMSKRFDGTLEVIKSLLEYIEELDNKVSNTVIKSGFAFEKPVAKKKATAYGNLANKVKELI